MKRRNFTTLSYLVAALVLVIMLAPEAEARFIEMTMIFRVTGSVKAAVAAAIEPSAVPEPSRVLLLMGGALSLLMRRKR